ncbi:MAG: hypothetical protein ACREM1_08625, partial [Longimicrobiales bacterium]
SVFPDDDGMYVVKGRLTPEVGALLMRAIEAAGALPRAAGPSCGVTGGSGGRPAPCGRGRATRRAGARGGIRTCRTGNAADVPISGTRAERYQVVVHVDAETLSSEGVAGRAELEDGTNVSAERVASSRATRAWST